MQWDLRVEEEQNGEPSIIGRQRRVEKERNGEPSISLQEQSTIIKNFLAIETNKLPFISRLHSRYVRKTGQTLLDNFQREINAKNEELTTEEIVNVTNEYIQFQQDLTMLLHEPVDLANAEPISIQDSNAAAEIDWEDWDIPYNELPDAGTSNTFQLTDKLPDKSNTRANQVKSVQPDETANASNQVVFT